MSYQRQYFVSDQTLSAESLNQIELGIVANEKRIEKLETNTLTPVDRTIVIKQNSIDIGISQETGNLLERRTDGLYVGTNNVNNYVPGTGLIIEDNTLSIYLAAETHGLVAVNNALMLNLATTNSDGAMSKEDKILLNSLENSVTQLEQKLNWEEF